MVAVTAGMSDCMLASGCLPSSSVIKQFYITPDAL